MIDEAIRDWKRAVGGFHMRVSDHHYSNINLVQYHIQTSQLPAPFYYSITVEDGEVFFKLRMDLIDEELLDQSLGFAQDMPVNALARAYHEHILLTPKHLIDLLDNIEDNIDEFIHDSIDISFTAAQTLGGVITDCAERPTEENYYQFYDVWKTFYNAPRYDLLTPMMQIQTLGHDDGVRYAWGVAKNDDRDRVVPVMVRQANADNPSHFLPLGRFYDRFSRQSDRDMYTFTQIPDRHVVHRAVTNVPTMEDADHDTPLFAPAFDGWIDAPDLSFAFNGRDLIGVRLWSRTSYPSQVQGTIGTLRIGAKFYPVVRIATSAFDGDLPAYLMDERYIYTYIDSCKWVDWETMPVEGYELALTYHRLEEQGG